MTTRALEHQIAEPQFPAELWASARRALLTLKMMRGQERQFSQSAAIRQDSKRIRTEFVQAAADFANKGTAR